MIAGVSYLLFSIYQGPLAVSILKHLGRLPLFAAALSKGGI